MGSYGTLTNQSFDIDALLDARNNGWSISGGLAIHESCNQGFIRNRAFVADPGKEYTVTYTVSGYSSGAVYAVIGGANGVARSSDGVYTEALTAVDASGLYFWSDGDLAVSSVIISDGQVSGATLVFNEKYNKFVGWRSYQPYFAAKFLDDVLMFVDGRLWKQGSNSDRNNFFGQQYPSVIEFYVNINPSSVKTFYSIREVGSHAWRVTDITIPSRSGKSSGQKSRITSNLFKRLQGEFFADFLRDINDPRFTNPDIALFKGAVLQGEIAKITIEINNTEEVRLVSVDILGAYSGYTY